uniref:Uncharacterized protein n=1 Tax=Stegastes partitus TaxID=144197 RepID=A0A3B5ARG7_9TELE
KKSPNPNKPSSAVPVNKTGSGVAPPAAPDVMEPIAEQGDEPADGILLVKDEEQLPYQDLGPVVCFRLRQTTRLRNWFLDIIYLLGTQTAFNIDYTDEVSDHSV